MEALRQEGEEEKKALTARMKELESSLESARFVGWAWPPVAWLVWPCGVSDMSTPPCTSPPISDVPRRAG